jgi:uncharacterized protein YkwD
MPQIRTAVIAALATAAALAPAVPAAAAPVHPILAFSSACPGADLVPNAGNLALVRQATLCLLNRERVTRGLRPLRSNRRLQRAATGYSRTMVSHRFFAHVSGISTPSLRMHRVGYLRDDRAWMEGENIAWAGGSLATARSIVRLWMHSPPHRANILTGRFRDLGVGIALGAPTHLAGGVPAATYTTDFGWVG